MERYNYYKAVKNDILDLINFGDIDLEELAREHGDMNDIYDALYDDLFIDDAVTGNTSGSYTFNTWKAEEYICHNLDLLGEALQEFGCGPEYLIENGAEDADVIIRCYVLSEALQEALDEVEDEIIDIWEEMENESEVM